MQKPLLVVTRPLDQHQELMESLSQQGYETVHRPLMQITAIADDNKPTAVHARQCVLDLDHYDGIIAISRNASEMALDWIDRYWPQAPMRMAWFAVGPTTAEPLRQAGFSTIMPESRYDSEGLLACHQLSEEQVAGQRWLIFRGIGGRETLANTLRQRGARVDYAELYQRQPVSYQIDDWHTILQQKPMILLSSGQALDLLERQIPDLMTRVSGIMVPSARVAEKAKQQGYAQVLVAASARNSDTLACLNNFYQS